MNYGAILITISKTGVSHCSGRGASSANHSEYSHRNRFAALGHQVCCTNIVRLSYEHRISCTHWDRAICTTHQDSKTVQRVAKYVGSRILSETQHILELIVLVLEILHILRALKPFVLIQRISDVCGGRTDPPALSTIGCSVGEDMDPRDIRQFLLSGGLRLLTRSPESAMHMSVPYRSLSRFPKS